jgi:hypothetical protein
MKQFSWFITNMDLQCPWGYIKYAASYVSNLVKKYWLIIFKTVQIAKEKTANYLVVHL